MAELSNIKGRVSMGQLSDILKSLLFLWLFVFFFSVLGNRKSKGF